jgi:hypothetical protein
MHRLTARLLLLFALVGNLAPIALAACTAPPHACCLRKGSHHCQDSAAAESNKSSFRAPDCCNHDCCRAATTAQWAHRPPQLTQLSVRGVEQFLREIQPAVPSADAALFHSPRAPPRSIIS